MMMSATKTVSGNAFHGKPFHKWRILSQSVSNLQQPINTNCSLCAFCRFDMSRVEFEDDILEKLEDLG